MNTPKKILVLLYIFLSGCTRESGGDKDYEALSKQNISCTSPAELEVQPWGKNGVSRSCNIKDGDFIAAESGYVHFRGRYKGGKQVGVWRWYDEKGNVVKEIDYSPRGSR